MTNHYYAKATIRTSLSITHIVGGGFVLEVDKMTAIDIYNFIADELVKFAITSGQTGATKENIDVTIMLLKSE
jgi:hypothetical protein